MRLSAVESTKDNSSAAKKIQQIDEQIQLLKTQGDAP